MNKRLFAAIAAVMLLLTMVLISGCSGTNTMLMGRWKLSKVGDAAGGNQQDYPLPVVVDIYPDGHVDMLESSFGTYTKDRDTFTFKSDDGTFITSGSYKLEYPNLTIFLDDSPSSYLFEKQADLPQLQTLLKQKKASAAAAAPATATPAATATPTAAAAN
jgi:hypothetical protein